MVRTGDWAQLPSDLLGKIAEHLTQLHDQIRFRCVCVSWRSASNSFAIKLPSQLPWLLLDSNQETYSDRCRYFSLSENRIYAIPLPESRTYEFFSSSHDGWLAVGGNGSLSLLNPLTRRSIPLPPLPEERGWKPPVKKLKLFGSDLVAALCPSIFSIFFFRLGEASWKRISVSSDSGDFSYHNGSLFLVSCIWQTMEVLDTMALERVARIPLAARYQHCRPYLVNLPSGELLLLLRNVQNNYRRKRFELFRLDRIGQKLKWTKTSSIGDSVLFVDGDNAMSFASSDFRGCPYRRNCIYFGDYEIRKRGYCRPKNYGMRLFDIAEGHEEHINFFSDDPSMMWAWAIWVVPRLC